VDIQFRPFGFFLTPNALYDIYRLKILTLSTPGEWLRFSVMVFNSTFNNISVISLPSILLVEETGVPGKTIDLPQVTDKLNNLLLYRVQKPVVPTK